MRVHTSLLVVSLVTIGLFAGLSSAAAGPPASTPTPTATPTPNGTPGPPDGVSTSAPEVSAPSNGTMLAQVSPTVMLLDYTYHPENDTMRVVVYAEVPEQIQLRDAFGPFRGSGVSEISASSSTTVTVDGRAVITVQAKPMRGKVGVVLSTDGGAVAITTKRGSSFRLGPYGARDVQVAALTAFVVTSGVGVWRLLRAYYGPDVLQERIA